ncbi:MAG TPA: hypothetical protein VMM15_19600 [Bradyrhizobium sp.]|nr:hypothetical protein [Bradyrhizobium sp.]
MVRTFRSVAMATALLGLSVLRPVNAEAFDLTGAWATQADLCGLVFTKKAGKVAFAEMSDLYGSGFVIDGKNIRGKTAQCTIQSRKDDGDSIELAAACATTIMKQNVRFPLKVLDNDNIVRLFPEIEGMTLRYARCKL